jgi:hypothetical protein
VAAPLSSRQTRCLRPNVMQCNCLQVASANGCVIFDLHGICSCAISIDAFSDLMERLLLSSSCTKIFYGCVQDMKKLRSSWPFVSAFSVGVRRCLELNHLAAAVYTGVRDKSLSDVCLAVLGQSLDKTHRMSNWAQKPLTPEQIAYAALDVYAPIMIYERLYKGSNDHEAAAAAGSRVWFEKFCFDLPAAIIATDDSQVMCTNSRASQRFLDKASAVCLAAGAAQVRVRLPLSSCPNDSDEHDPAEVAFESPADSKVTSITCLPSPRPKTPSCLGTSEVLAVLESGRGGGAYEIIHFSRDDWGSGCVESKFEVFDRRQAHADAVGMTRRQVRSLRAVDV